MNPFGSQIDRRAFLLGTSLTAGLIAAHGDNAFSPPASDIAAGGENRQKPHIAHLETLTAAPLAEMKAFYHKALGLPVLENKPERITFQAGESRLTFLPATTERDKPFYHFAFNIPENKIRAARTWHLERSPLIVAPERLRDSAYPNEVVNYSHWNAHSLFFYDPGGNVVEYIARHDLKNPAPGAFRSKDILCISEIGLIVDDVLSVAAALKEVARMEAYRGESEAFTALGDERGLLLVMQRGRILNFHPTSKKKAARIFQTSVRVHGLKQEVYPLPGFPYTLSNTLS